MNTRIFSPCPMDIAVELIGGKWKPAILFHIQKGRTRPSELEKAITKISKRVLTQQLSELLRDKLIQKTIYPVLPPKVEYQLTPIGKNIIPVLDAMENFGIYYQNLGQNRS